MVRNEHQHGTGGSDVTPAAPFHVCGSPVLRSKAQDVATSALVGRSAQLAACCCRMFCAVLHRISAGFPLPPPTPQRLAASPSGAFRRSDLPSNRAPARKSGMRGVLSGAKRLREGVRERGGGI